MAKRNDKSNLLTPFTLNFTQHETQKKYDNELINFVIFIKIVCFVNLLYSACCVIIHYMLDLNVKREFYIILIFIILALNLFILIFLNFKKSINFHKIILSAIYVSFSFINLITKNILEEYYKPKQTDLYSNKDELDFNCIFLFFDVVIKFLWIISPFNNFIHILISNFIILSFYPLLYFIYLNVNRDIVNFIYFYIFYFVITLFSRVLDKMNKNLFLLAQDLDEEGQKSKLSIMNNGYIHLDNNRKMKHINSFFLSEISDFFNMDGLIMKEKIERFISEKTEISVEETKEFIQKILSDFYEFNTTLDINQHLLKKISFNYTNRRKSLSNLHNHSLDTNEILIETRNERKFHNSDILNMIMFNKNKLSEFTFLGRKVVIKEEGKNVLSLEIYVRVKDEEIELVFNDTTKIDLHKGLSQFIINSGQFLHDFKNPLICINQEITDLKIFNDYICDILQSNREFSEMLQEYGIIQERFDYVIQMSEYCQTMIASYEDFSKKIFKPKDIKMNFELFEIKELLFFIKNLMRFKLTRQQAKRIDFIIECDKSIQTVKSDENKIKQVLINIISNAEKFTSTGSITLRVVRETMNGQSYIKFSVQDTGIGMDSGSLNNLYSPFFSLANREMNKNGCGLGLIIVKEMTESLGIGVQISSTPGQGTLVWFYVLDHGGREMDYLFEGISSMPLEQEIQKQATPKSESGTKLKEGKEKHFNKMIVINDDPDLFKLPNEGNMTPTYFLDAYSNFSSKITFPYKDNLGSLRNILRRPSYKNNEPNMKYTYTSGSPIKTKNSTEMINDMGHKFSKFKAITYELDKPILKEITKERELEIEYSNFELIGVKNKYNKHNSANLSHPSNVEKYVITNDESAIIKFQNFKTRVSKDIKMENKETTPSRRNTKNNVSYFSEYVKLVQQNYNLKEDDLSNNEDSFEEKKTQRKSIDILIVDDSNQIRSTCKNIIQQIDKNQDYNINVDEADDGIVALCHILDKYIKKNNSYDIILLDDEMNYCNGTDLYKILKYLTDNKIGEKAGIKKDILSKIVFCTGAPSLILNKIDIDSSQICDKPIKVSFLKSYIGNLFTFNTK